MLPVVVKSVAVAAAAECNDGVGSSNGPKHAGAFEAGTHHGFASGFDHAGAYEQVLLAEFGIAHTFGTPFEVVASIRTAAANSGFSGGQRPQFGYQLLDL